MKKQCQAVTGASTYSAPHRCLNRAKKQIAVGSQSLALCRHHVAMMGRKKA